MLHGDNRGRRRRKVYPQECEGIALAQCECCRCSCRARCRSRPGILQRRVGPPAYCLRGLIRRCVSRFAQRMLKIILWPVGPYSSLCIARLAMVYCTSSAGASARYELRKPSVVDSVPPLRRNVRVHKVSASVHRTNPPCAAATSGCYHTATTTSTASAAPRAVVAAAPTREAAAPFSSLAVSERAI